MDLTTNPTTTGQHCTFEKIAFLIWFFIFGQASKLSLGATVTQVGRKKQQEWHLVEATMKKTVGGTGRTLHGTTAVTQRWQLQINTPASLSLSQALLLLMVPLPRNVWNWVWEKPDHNCQTFHETQRWLGTWMEQDTCQKDSSKLFHLCQLPGDTTYKYMQSYNLIFTLDIF